MKRVDIEELTKAFNKCRMENKGKVFFREEMIEVLQSLGFRKNICWDIISHGYVNHEQVGKHKLYQFSADPLHKSQIFSMYDHRRKMANKRNEDNSLKEEEALKLLQEKGYQIRKVKGFDLERFEKENPILYKKYLIYESI